MNSNAKELPRITPEAFAAMEKDDQFNYELIDGIVMMSPSPSKAHQRIANRVNYMLLKAFETSDCEPLYELDIKLDDTILKPDLMVFCDQDADIPEIVFEILSPSTRQHDLLVKPRYYQMMGVKEYWILDPKLKNITVHDFIHNRSDAYGLGEIAHSLARPEIALVVSEIFA